MLMRASGLMCSRQHGQRNGVVLRRLSTHSEQSSCAPLQGKMWGCRLLMSKGYMQTAQSRLLPMVPTLYPLYTYRGVVMGQSCDRSSKFALDLRYFALR